MGQPASEKLLNYQYRNKETLDSFVKYCADHPQFRFWQALRNWSGYGFVYVGGTTIEMNPKLIDTFPWEGRRQDE